MLWLNKGMVSRCVKMYPIVIRSLWIHSSVRNGSGNGGGVIIGFMPMVHYDSVYRNVINKFEQVTNPKGDKGQRKGVPWLEFAQFKAEIYHGVLGKIFSRLRDVVREGGLAHMCADHILHLFLLGIHIGSLDGEEACAFVVLEQLMQTYPAHVAWCQMICLIDLT
jgi:hypothetical protein